MEIKNSLKSWLLLLILALIWGSSFVLIKKGLNVLAPGEVGALRIASAFVVLLPFALRGMGKVKSHEWKYLIIVGMAGSFLPAIFFAIAQTQIPSAITGVLNSLTPIFTIIIGWVFYKKRPLGKIFLGVGIGFFGTVLLIITNVEGISSANFYALFVVMATILYGTNLNIIKHHLKELRSLTITSVSLVMVGPVAIIYLFGFTDFYFHYSSVDGGAMATLYIIILGVFGTGLALILFNALVKITDPIFASSVTYLIPVIAIFWGLIDNEKLLFQHYMGMLLIILGVYFANKPQRSKTDDSTK